VRCAAFTIVMSARAALAETVPDYISAAIADVGRPHIDRQRDTDRKPAEVVAFAGIEPGDKVADFLPGSGYFTKVLCRVVGDSGHLYAISVPSSQPESMATSTTESLGGGCTNVTTITLQSRIYPAPELYSPSDDPGGVYEYRASRLPAESFVAPEPLDVIWISQGYHALHNKELGAPNMRFVDATLLTALKPGGFLIIEDHAAKAGSGVRDTATLHRIDPEQVKREASAVGFIFIGESAVLRRADDPHTADAHQLADKADRFLLKFRRPL
jgi:predicted methyltransferase